MIETDDYIVLVESPAQWGLEPGHHWMSGWFVAKPGRIYHDVRAWVDDVCYLGILGLPRRDLHARFNYGLGSLLAEFYLEFDAWPGASRIRLEVLDEHYRWIGVWRSDLLVLGEPTPAPRPRLPAGAIPRLFETLLKDHARRPLLPLDDLAEEHVAGCAAFFLNRHPHRPFDGFIDHPTLVAPSQFDRVTLKGWVFHPEQPIVHLLGCTGGGGLVHLDHGQPRPEVAARFPQVPLAAHSQFFGFSDIDASAPNPLLVRVYAELANGEMHIVFARRFFQRSTQDAEAPYPPRSRALFRQVERAFRDACRRHRIDLPSRIGWWRGREKARHDFLARPAYTARRRALSPAPPPGPNPRVLFLSHNLKLEGAPLFLFEYAAWLRAREEWDVTVLSGEDGPLHARYRDLGIAVQVVDTSQATAPASPAAYRAAVRTLADTIRAAIPCDLVIANTLVSFWGIDVATALGRPSLLYIHESATVPRFFFERLPASCLPLVDAALIQADRVCFLTPTTRTYYEAHHRADNFQLVSSWTQLAAIRAFRAAHRRSELRARHGITEDTLVVVNVGTVCERKGQQVFTRAIDLLRQRHPALHRRSLFLMVGGRPTDFQRTLERDLDWLDLSGIRVVNETDDVYDYYALADLFVCTSFEESFPRVILEAMAFELPIVSTDVHGIPEIVRDGVEAVLVPAGSPSDLADAMARTLQDPAAAATRAARAATRVEQRFAHDHVLPQHVKLLRQVVSGRPPV